MVQVVKVNIGGPQGPPGTAENEQMFAKRIDFLSGTENLYRAEAAVGSLDSEAKWRIRFIQIAVDGDITEEWAGGTDSFDKIWDDRASLTYT